MINHRFRWIQVGLIAAIIPALAVAPFGCSEDEPEPVVRRTYDEEPEPVLPDATLIASELMVDPKLTVDSVIMTGCTPDHVRAAISFADTFARGDAETLKPMLDGTSKGVLDDLLAHGWTEEVGMIQAVSLQQTSYVAGMDQPLLVTFSVSKRGGDRVVLNWQGKKRGDMYVFSPTTDIAALEAEEMLRKLQEAAEEETEASDASGPGERNRNRPNPNDPRRRVPRERPAPTDPGNPGSPG